MKNYPFGVLLTLSTFMISNEQITIHLYKQIISGDAGKLVILIYCTYYLVSSHSETNPYKSVQKHDIRNSAKSRLGPVLFSIHRNRTILSSNKQFNIKLYHFLRLTRIFLMCQQVSDWYSREFRFILIEYITITDISVILSLTRSESVGRI